VPDTGATRWISARPDTTEHIIIEFDRRKRNREAEMGDLTKIEALFFALVGGAPG